MSVAVAAVTQGLASGGLAAAEKYFFAVSGLVLQRHELAALMGTVAKRLAGAFAAGTPEIGFAGLHFNAKGGVGSSNGISHIRFPSVGLSVDMKTV
jgi:hypothetical protein